MSADPFHLNRPVHLARRDVFFGKADGRIRALPARPPDEQRRAAAQALYLLREARRHARAANLADKTSVQSRLFVELLDAVIAGVHSVAQLLGPRNAAAADHPLDRFLGVAGAGERLSAHRRHCADHILEGLAALLGQAEKPFGDLRRTSLAKMTAEDKARYEKAYAHFASTADGEAEKAAEFPGRPPQP